MATLVPIPQFPVPSPDDILPRTSNNQDSLTSLVILAAGLSSRFGAPKQLEAVGPGGALLFEYSIHDALGAGIGRVVLVVSPGVEDALRHHLEPRYPGIDIRFAIQEAARRSDGSTKPWGTGHAVLAATSVLDGPFVVANADDYYGPAGYRALAGLLGAPAPGPVPHWGMVGYPLSATLSPHGGVSRAICEVDEDFRVTRTIEILDVRDTPDGIRGRTLDGGVATLTGAEWVSMSLWGFTPEALPLLQTRFDAFLAERAGELGAEFLLTAAVDDILAQNQATLRLFPSPDPWFGMTHPADRDAVRGRIGELVERGLYPGGGMSGEL